MAIALSSCNAISVNAISATAVRTDLSKADLLLETDSSRGLAAASAATTPGLSRIDGVGEEWLLPPTYPRHGIRPQGLGSPPLTPATQRVSWILEFNPSLLNMWVTWVSTVHSERKSLVAIWRLVMSSAIKRATSNSLLVSEAEFVSPFEESAKSWGASGRVGR